MTRPLQDPATTRTGRETCERETAAWVHWYNTRRPLSLGGITPQQAENQHTTTRKEAASTSLHKTRDLTHPLRGIAPVTWRCTRYVALHPNRRGAMPTDRVHDPSHKLADLPKWRSTNPTGAGHGDGRAWRGFETTRARLAVRRSRGAEPQRGAHIQPARARGAHTTRPGPVAPSCAADPGLVNVYQTRRSTIRFANASSAVFASPLGSGASAATASSAQVRAS